MNKKRYLIIVGIVAAAALISILLYTMLANHQPVITSLEAEADWATTSGSYQVTCNASDSDGDKLSYNWSTSTGNISGTGASVNWTAPPFEGSYNATVMVTVTDGHGGEVMESVTIRVRPDNPLTINSLIANAAWTSPSGSLQVTCNVSDPEGDNLSYEWTATGGKISGTGAAINWTAPQAVGTYNVTVVVKDGYGGKDIRKVPLSVARSTPPNIENLIVTAKGHIFLRKSTAGGDYDVWKTKEYDIQCQVADTSVEVFYTWSCDGGEISKISEDGSMITWTAPNQASIEATVTVIVSDEAGNSVAKNMVFTVPSCACGHWVLD